MVRMPQAAPKHEGPLSSAANYGEKSEGKVTWREGT